MTEARAIILQKHLVDSCPRELMENFQLPLKIRPDSSLGMELEEIISVGLEFYDEIMGNQFFEEEHTIYFLVLIGNDGMVQYHLFLTELFNAIKDICEFIANNKDSFSELIACRQMIIPIQEMLCTIELVTHALRIYSRTIPNGITMHNYCEKLIPLLIKDPIDWNSKVNAGYFLNCYHLTQRVPWNISAGTLELMLKIFLYNYHQLDNDKNYFPGSSFEDVSMIQTLINTKKSFKKVKLDRFFQDIALKNRLLITNPTSAARICSLAREELGKDNKKFNKFVTLILEILHHNAQSHISQFLVLFTKEMDLHASTEQYIHLFLHLIMFLYQNPFEAFELNVVFKQLILYELQYSDGLLFLTKALFCSAISIDEENETSINHDVHGYLQQIALLVINHYISAVGDGFTGTHDEKEQIKAQFRRFLESIQATSALYNIVFCMKDEDWSNVDQTRSQNANSSSSQNTNCEKYLQTSHKCLVSDAAFGSISEWDAAKDAINVLNAPILINREFKSFTNLTSLHLWFQYADKMKKTVVSNAWTHIFFAILRHYSKLPPSMNIPPTHTLFGKWEKTFQLFRSVINQDGLYRNCSERFIEAIIHILAMMLSSKGESVSIDVIFVILEASINRLTQVIVWCKQNPSKKRAFENDHIDYMEMMPSGDRRAVQSIMTDQHSKTLLFQRQQKVNEYIYNTVVVPLADRLSDRMLLFGQCLGILQPRLLVDSEQNKDKVNRLQRIEFAEFQRLVNAYGLRISEVQIQQRASDTSFSLAKQALLAITQHCLEKYIGKTEISSCAKYETIEKLNKDFDPAVERRVAEYLFSLNSVFEACRKLNAGEDFPKDFVKLQNFQKDTDSAFKESIECLGDDSILHFQHNQMIALYLLYGSEATVHPFTVLKVGTGQGKTLLQAATAIKYLKAPIPTNTIHKCSTALNFDPILTISIDKVICKVCDQSLGTSGTGGCIFTINRNFRCHERCFRCTACHQPLDSQTFIMREGGPVHPLCARKVIVLTCFRHLAERDQHKMKSLYSKWGFTSAFLDLNNPESCVNAQVIYADSQEFIQAVREHSANVSPNAKFLEFAHGDWSEYLIILDEVDVLLEKDEYRNCIVNCFNLLCSTHNVGNFSPDTVRSKLQSGDYLKIANAIDYHENLAANNQKGGNITEANQSGETYIIVGSMGYELNTNKRLYLYPSYFSIKWKMSQAKRIIGFSGTVHKTSLDVCAAFLQRPEIPELFKFWEIPLFFDPNKKHGDLTCRRIFANMNNQLTWLDDAIREGLLPSTTLSNASKGDAFGSLDDWVAEIQKDIESAKQLGQAVVIFVRDPEHNTKGDKTNYINLLSTKLMIEKGYIFSDAHHTADKNLQKIATPFQVSICTKKIGRGADIRVHMDMTHGLHVIIATPDYREEMLQQIGRTGRMNRKGSFSFIFHNNDHVPSYERKDRISSDEFKLKVKNLHLLSDEFFRKFSKKQLIERTLFAWYLHLLDANYDIETSFEGLKRQLTQLVLKEK